MRGSLPPLSREYKPIRNPPWSSARWRGGEQPFAAFSQWWYVMLTDAETGATFSVGLGAFRGTNESGGWLRYKGQRGGTAPAERVPQLSLPFSRFSAAPAPEFDVRVDGDGGAFLRLREAGAGGLRLSASLPAPASAGPGAAPAGWAWVELDLTRVYGVFGTGEARAPSEGGGREGCALANLPFAYDSEVEGELCLGGGCGRLGQAGLPGSALRVERGPRWRAYVESTVHCGAFPAPGPRARARPERFPWKWMLAVAPPGSPRGGRETGEVGLVMSQARLPVALPLLGEVDAEGAFFFLDLPSLRVGGVNVTLGRQCVLCAAAAGGGAALPGERLTALHLEEGEWEELPDDGHGAAALPLRQSLLLVGPRHAAAVTFATSPDHYARLAIKYKTEAGEPRVVSDFRATHARAYLRVVELDGGGAAAAGEPAEGEEGGGQPLPEDAPHVDGALSRFPGARLLFQGYAPHNGLEFAYHAAFRE